MSETAISIEDGVKTIKLAVKKLPDSPGVYRMLSLDGDVLYVGKAKSLRKRVVSYTHIDKLPNRLQRMVAETKSLEIVTTHTEVEALLLESNLIKKFKPRFNVLLRDDKSFPYIALTLDKEFPQMIKHRGAKSKKIEYYGPFASAGAVNRTITALQRAFMIRNCSDSYFKARKRPCLQYHIKRCSAPCVGYVDEENYKGQVEAVRSFLSGENHNMQQDLAKKMQAASDDLDYESAARYRDRIRALSSIQASQDINTEHIKNADVIALFQDDNARSCIQIFFIRGGQNYGNRAFFPRHDSEESPAKILSAFCVQFYENKPVAPEILLSHVPEDQHLMIEAFSESSGKKIDVRKPVRGEGRRLVEFALRNAEEALKRDVADKMGQKKILDKVAQIFDLDDAPSRIEIYDNSHVSGEQMVGAMVVATPEGFQKNAYRKFNIKQAAKADDYGMMREVLTRRFSRALKEDVATDDETWPDLILIDGGKGQLSVTMDVLTELNIQDDMCVAAISKGPDRNAGREIIHQPGKTPVMLEHNDPALHYLQRIRDEAHRFAIGAHRQKRQKNLVSSPLDDVPGVGAKRKKALLHYFGSAKEVKRAGIEDLQKAEGISEAVARKIYNYFHDK